MTTHGTVQSLPSDVSICCDPQAGPVHPSPPLGITETDPLPRRRDLCPRQSPMDGCGVVTTRSPSWSMSMGSRRTQQAIMGNSGGA
jgi:hypothetical protein